MIWQVEMEGLRIVGEYYDTDGRRLKGAFATSDDSAVIVNVNVLEDLLHGSVEYDGGGEFTLEQAEEEYGEEIAKKFLATKGVSGIFSLDEVDAAFGDQIIEKRANEAKLRAAEASRKNQKLAHRASVERNHQNQAFIIKFVIEGMPKLDIEHQFGFCRNTINKVFKNLSEQSLNDIWFKYKDTVFENTDRQLVNDFISCGCDYVAYRRYLDARRMEMHRAVPVNEQINQVEDEVVEVVAEESVVDEKESDEIPDDFAEAFDDFAADAPVLVDVASEGVAEALAVESNPDELARQTYDKSAYVAALKQKSEDKPATLEDVIDLFNEPDIELPKFQKPITVNDDIFVERYSKRTMHQDEKPKVDTSMSDGGNCQILKARKGVGLYTESIY